MSKIRIKKKQKIEFFDKISDHFEASVEETLDSSISNSFKQSILSEALINIMRFEGPVIDAVLEEFPVMIAAVKNPTKEMRKFTDISLLRYCNVLDEDDIKRLVLDDIYWLDDLDDKHKPTVAKVMTLEFIEELGRSVVDFELGKYETEKWYIEIRKLFDLAEA